MKKFLFPIFIIVFSIIFSCKSMRYSTPKSYFVVYYINDSVNQYFIKPILYKSKKDNLIIDFTFRDSTLNCDVTTNYSILTRNRTLKIDSAYFLLNSDKIRLKSPKKMFIDKKSKNYVIRYSNIINFEDLDQITLKQASIIAYYNDKQHIFKPTKNSKKILTSAQEDIIDIIKINKQNED